jgi:peptidoglycan/LPS O-acetylase OafA/YrhL
MKLYKLEAIRGFAAFYVILHHTLPHSYKLFGINIGSLLSFGQEPVILFFLLSGFVINYSYQQGKDKTFKTYFSKRFLRIYIPLLFIFLLGYTVKSLQNNGLVDIRISELIGNIFMLQDIGYLKPDIIKPNVIVEPYMRNLPLWSLGYEWWFYMLFFPLMTFIKKNTTRDNFVFAISIAATLIYTVQPNFIVRLLMYFGVWWCGVYLSSLYLANKEITISQIKYPCAVLSIICVILSIKAFYVIQGGTKLLFGAYPILEIRHISCALFIMILSAFWQQMKWKGFDLLFKPFLFLAPISYVIYISHYHIYSLFQSTHLKFIGNPFLKYILFIVVLLGFSYILEIKLYPYIRKKITNITMPSKLNS